MSVDLPEPMFPSTHTMRHCFGCSRPFHFLVSFFMLCSGRGHSGEKELLCIWACSVIEGPLWFISGEHFPQKGGPCLLISIVAMIPTSEYMADVHRQLSMARLMLSPFSLIPTARPPSHLSLVHKNISSNTHIVDQRRIMCGSP